MSKPNKRTPLPIPSGAQCIEYNTARIILSEWYDPYRATDATLHLLEGTERHWHDPKENEMPIFNLIVEQGFFTSIWDGNDEGKLRTSMRCEELIYSDDFLRACARQIIPDFTPSPCDAMGRGRRTWHTIREYHQALVTAGFIANLEKAASDE